MTKNRLPEQLPLPATCTPAGAAKQGPASRSVILHRYEEVLRRMSDDHDKADFAGGASLLKEQLVAYLDGELDEPVRQRIEAQLAVDPGLRESLRRLEQTWDLLDGLNQADVDESFTRSTMEMVALAASDDVQRRQQEAPRRRRRRWIIAGSSLLAASLVGYMGVALFWTNPNDQLLNDLSLLENLDQISQIDDVEFLRQLAAEGVFAEEDGDER